MQLTHGWKSFKFVFEAAKAYPIASSIMSSTVEFGTSSQPQYNLFIHIVFEQPRVFLAYNNLPLKYAPV
jgi:hypothetical protein